MNTRADVKHHILDELDVSGAVRTIAALARRAIPVVMGLLLLTGAITVAVSCTSKTVAFRHGNVTSTLSVEIADTPEVRSRGLSGRESLGANSGMLFTWDEDVEHDFSMEQTSIPLSIAFISSEGSIIQILDLEPFDMTEVNPGVPYRHAIEVNQGWFEEKGIMPGTAVLMDSIR